MIIKRVGQINKLKVDERRFEAVDNKKAFGIELKSLRKRSL